MCTSGPSLGSGTLLSGPNTEKWVSRDQKRVSHAGMMKLIIIIIIIIIITVIVIFICPTDCRKQAHILHKYECEL